MNDWQHALAGSPWLAHTIRAVELGTAHGWDRPPIPSLPHLSRLLQAARVTPVVVDSSPYEVLAWDLADGSTTGWLCLPPSTTPPVGPPDALHDLWRVTGGVVDRWNDPDTWVCNHNSVLTPELAAASAAELVADCSFLWDGLSLPIDPAEYGVLAEEANRNLTLFHRASGEVLLFAQDHAFGYVETLDGCPEYTFHRIPSAPDVTAWVETVAGQWLAAVRR
ncbi:hypothetical protein [Kribbella sp. DT2]|uniref:hypothetical protein n=1 Tax=Kribbella sp. DT2 TaxID=3393427 RepID=UPI003CF2C739